MAEQAASGLPGLLAPSRWSIQRSPALLIGPAVLLLALALEALLLRRWSSLSLGPGAAAATPLVVAGAVGVLALLCHLLSCLTARYILDGSALTIVRGTARWTVPLADITGVAQGETGAILTRRIWLPGLWMGSGYIKDGGPAVFAASAPPVEAVSVRTDACTYLLSPERRQRFLDALEAARAQAATTAAAPTVSRQPAPGYLDALLHPAPAVLAVLAAIANWALFVEILRWTPAMPPLVPVHFTAMGAVDRWGQPAALLWLGQIGAAVLAMNLALSLLAPFRRPATAALLMAIALLVQIVLWLAFAALLP